MRRSRTEVRLKELALTTGLENQIEYAAIASVRRSRTEVQLKELALPTGFENQIEYAAIAQLVEQGTENPCVLGSIPSCGISFYAVAVCEFCQSGNDAFRLGKT